MSYCLLGLFGINIPLLYGEGEAAFQRLQEELFRVSTDDSIFVFSIQAKNADRKSDRRSVFADHVGCFASSGGVDIGGYETAKSTSRYFGGQKEPSSVSDIGLSIKAKVLQIHHHHMWIRAWHHVMPLHEEWFRRTVLMPLRCSLRDEDGVKRQLALLLQTRGLESQPYYRLSFGGRIYDPVCPRRFGRYLIVNDLHYQPGDYKEDEESPKKFLPLRMCSLQRLRNLLTWTFSFGNLHNDFSLYLYISGRSSVREHPLSLPIMFRFVHGASAAAANSESLDSEQ